MNYKIINNSKISIIIVFLVIIIFLKPVFLYTQQTKPQKLALVIGNGAYTYLTPLANPVNDANDIALALESLNFTVDKVINGSLEDMENAILRLKDKLSVSEDAYSFFFYAGHGVQSSGENFLIPVNANIPSESFLKNRSVSVQSLLDELNDAKNSLNIVVLDACRDNPFGWNRSSTRGLAIITNQPADSIIVYATSAGQKASDGDGRNGLFTSQLLKNLTTPGLDVGEIFRRTGADVAEASRRQQIPAIYNQFFGLVTFTDVPVNTDIANSTQPSMSPNRTLNIIDDKKLKLWSVGAQAGTSISDPWIIGTIRGTLAPFRYSFFELGIDLGIVSSIANAGFYSLTPFINYCFYYPFNNVFGLYAGIGGGYIMSKYYLPDDTITLNTFAAEVSAGITIFDIINISYTLRTNFKGTNHKISAGYFYRFK
ncbi:MAG: caspase family protein [Treponema sp.]|nr:caspase family protein [Treponema sp.]